MTKTQQKVYDALRAFSERHGRAPTLSTLAFLLGLRSIGTVHKHLKSLEFKGLIQREKNKAGAITFPDKCPLCGRCS